MKNRNKDWWKYVDWRYQIEVYISWFIFWLEVVVAIAASIVAIILTISAIGKLI